MYKKKVYITGNIKKHIIISKTIERARHTVGIP